MLNFMGRYLVRSQRNLKFTPKNHVFNVVDYSKRLDVNGKNEGLFSTIVPSQNEDTESILSTSFGQPTPDTHPHLLKQGELVPGMCLKEFSGRRDRLVEAILKRKPDCPHIVIIPSAEVLHMTEKIPYVFRQNTDFRYLTGCLEPDSALMLSISDDGYKSFLFLRENNKQAELWEGPRTGVQKGSKMFGVDEAYSISELNMVLKAASNQFPDAFLWYDFIKPANSGIHKTLVTTFSEGKVKDFVSPRDLIHKLRLIKSESEQALLQKSAQIASKAVEEAMKFTKPGVTEHKLFAIVDYHCRMKGAEQLAYPPVVASGSNANIIHYINNTQQVADGELVLVDAGCELHGYCSDITRTWPSNGCFNDIQKTLYEILLSVQLDLIAKSFELPTLDIMFMTMCNLLGKRLKEGHVLSKAADSEKFDKVAFKLCPHHVSHYLGMDVHDTATVSRSIPLQEGMLITIEPGLYIKGDCTLTKPEFRGCGLRIEDDVMITKAGPKVLSDCAKTVEDIESLMKCQQS